ncbi:hypothetical protein KJZ99_03550 [bacterium]|nr:hypothetical protein [bacterium]
MTRVAKHLHADDSGNHGDLPEQLRRISAALWEAAMRRDFESMNTFLLDRDFLLEKLVPSESLSDQHRRELLAVQAADRYLIRQLSSEIALLETRLKAIDARRAAARGYRPNAKTQLRISKAV